jgi:hypothetical protein
MLTPAGRTLTQTYTEEGAVRALVACFCAAAVDSMPWPKIELIYNKIRVHHKSIVIKLTGYANYA